MTFSPTSTHKEEDDSYDLCALWTDSTALTVSAGLERWSFVCVGGLLSRLSLRNTLFNVE